MLNKVGLREFKSQVAEPSDNEPVLVEFVSDLCPACKIAEPAVKELAKTYRIAQVNVGEDPDISNHFKVKSVPTFVVVKNRTAKHALVGAQPISKLKKLIDETA
jgi:thioredoxin-like negative regulator of GroEL